MARSIRSGQPRPLEDDTVTMASSGISAAASAAVRSWLVTSEARLDRDGAAGLRRLLHRKASCERPDAILAGGRGRPLAGDGRVELAEGTDVEIGGVDWELLFAGSGTER